MSSAFRVFLLASSEVKSEYFSIPSSRWGEIARQEFNFSVSVWYTLKQLFTSVSVKMVDLYLHVGKLLLNISYSVKNLRAVTFLIRSFTVQTAKKANAIKCSCNLLHRDICMYIFHAVLCTFLIRLTRTFNLNHSTYLKRSFYSPWPCRSTVR